MPTPKSFKARRRSHSPCFLWIPAPPKGLLAFSVDVKVPIGQLTAVIFFQASRWSRGLVSRAFLMVVRSLAVQTRSRCFNAAAQLSPLETRRLDWRLLASGYKHFWDKKTWFEADFVTGCGGKQYSMQHIHSKCLPFWISCSSETPQKDWARGPLWSLICRKRRPF